MNTPGHTKGGLCYILGDVVFSGDTLFFEDCGRCDLFSGSFEEMLGSLCRLRDLEGDYKIYPGHGPSTTLEHERKNNIYMNKEK
ncbi:putative polyketide biosynthesis zinc-dependent hydrolase BaeB [bioreactor metagenome]|uniref:Putative polyketide biosynthesis zinc-dependent hydrolase BaeB n=1 Tax=bioreactor metagenome TaxID=1076179 RepID=A0A645I520_9ZZZZ